MSTELQFEMMKKFWSGEWRWVHNNVLKYKLRTVKIVNFTLCVFYPNKKVPPKKTKFNIKEKSPTTAGSYAFLTPQHTMLVKSC